MLDAEHIDGYISLLCTPNVMNQHLHEIEFIEYSSQVSDYVLVFNDALKHAYGILEINIRYVVLRVQVFVSVHMVSGVYLIFCIMFISMRYMTLM